MAASGLLLFMLTEMQVIYNRGAGRSPTVLFSAGSHVRYYQAGQPHRVQQKGGRQRAAAVNMCMRHQVDL
jgi:hypothetical protein